MQLVKGVVLVVAVAAGTGGGCGDDGGGGRVDASTTDATPDAPVGNATIGPDGGSLISRDGVLTLTVPPNAVSAPTELSIDLVPQAMWPASVAAGDPVGEVYEIGPEGTAFAIPAVLTWTFAIAPANARDASGRPRVLFGGARSATDEITPHLSTVSTRGPGEALTVVAEIPHLSQQFLSARLASYGPDYSALPVAAVDADLRGGRHAVDVAWSANTIAAHPTAPQVGVKIEIRRSETSPVQDQSSAAWQTDLVVLNGSGFMETATFEPGSARVPAAMPRWRCQGPGMGTVRLLYWLGIEIVPGTVVTGAVSFSEDVDCYEREQKVEYTAEVAALGAGRIAELAVPATGTVNLADHQGAYAYRIEVPAGGTIRVCVAASMAAGVNYFPQFSPGYTFVDGAPGCTDLTNLDAANPNWVLVKVTGGGSPNDVTVTTSVP